MAAPGRGQRVGGGSTRGYSSRPDKVLPTLKIRNRQRRQYKALKQEVLDEMRARWREQAARRRANPEVRAKKNEQDRAARGRRWAAMTDRQRAEERAKRNARRRAVRARRKAAAAEQGPDALRAYLEQQRAAWRDRMARRAAVTGLSRWQRMSPAQRRRHTAAGVAKRRAKRAELMADPIQRYLAGQRRRRRSSPLFRRL